MAAYWKKKLSDKSTRGFSGRAEEVSFFESLARSAEPEYLVVYTSGVGGVGKTTLLEQFGSVARENDFIVGRVNESQRTIPDILHKFHADLHEQGAPFPTFSNLFGSYDSLRHELRNDRDFTVATIENSGRVCSAAVSETQGRLSQSTAFISYSHKNEKEMEALSSYLNVLKNIGMVDPWSDTRISGGADWQREIEGAISRASVAILLITVEFLNSEFILGKEVPAFLERARQGKVIVYPIIAKPCPWKAVDWLAQLNVRPKDGRPVWSGTESQVDQELTTIAHEIGDLTRKASAPVGSLPVSDPSVPVGHRRRDLAYPGVPEESLKFLPYLHRRVEDPQSRELLLNADAALTAAFMNDLLASCEDKRTLLVFDTWEFLCTFADQWLLNDVLAKNLDRIGPGLTLAIGGREQLSVGWDGYLHISRQIQLKPFTSEEADVFLINRGITKKDSRESIKKLSANLPLMLALLSAPSISQEKELSATREVIGRFLRWIPQQDLVRREAVLACAVPRFYDQGIIGRLVPDGNPDEIFKWLSEFSFTSSAAERRWQYHRIVRRLMLQYLYDRNQDQHQELHRRIVDYYETRMEGIDGGDASKRDYKHWRDLELEWLAHRLYLNEGFEQFVALFLKAFRRSSYAQELVNTFVAVQEDLAERSSFRGDWYTLFKEAPQSRDAEGCASTGWMPLFERLSEFEGLTDPFLRAFVHYELGYFYTAQKRFGLAERSFRNAISLQPNYVSPYNSLATVFRLTGRFDEAEQMYRQCMELAPEYIFPYYNMARLLHAKEQVEEAETFYRKWIELRPNLPYSYYNTANFLRRVGRLDEAADLYRRAIEMDPQHIDSYNNLGLVLETSGRLGEAEEVYGKAAAADPSDYRIRMNIAVVHSRSERFDEALASFRECVRIDSGRPDAHMYMGKLLDRLDRPQEALPAYIQAAEAGQPDVDLMYTIGELSMKLERREEALKWFEKYLELEPDDDEVLEAVSALRGSAEKS